MNTLKEEARRLARECAIAHPDIISAHDEIALLTESIEPYLLAFAKLVIERCADECDALSEGEFLTQRYDRTDRAINACAKAIRAMTAELLKELE